MRLFACFLPRVLLMLGIESFQSSFWRRKSANAFLLLHVQQPPPTPLAFSCHDAPPHQSTPPHLHPPLDPPCAFSLVQRRKRRRRRSQAQSINGQRSRVVVFLQAQENEDENEEEADASFLEVGRKNGNAISNSKSNDTLVQEEEGEPQKPQQQPQQQQEQVVVTKEMFLREMLVDPAPPPASAAAAAANVVVKRPSRNNNNNNSNPSSSSTKKRNRDYKVLDNRDSLPFAVELATPDPYTHPDVKRKRQAKVKKRRDAIEQSMTIYSMDSNNDNDNDSASAQTLLGEFQLDKHTTTGDLLVLGEDEYGDKKEYRVVRHRCLYKYAGGQRFVMVKKILQVKEVGRLQTEEYLARQWKNSNNNSSNTIGAE